MWETVAMVLFVLYATVVVSWAAGLACCRHLSKKSGLAVDVHAFSWRFYIFFVVVVLMFAMLLCSRNEEGITAFAFTSATITVLFHVAAWVIMWAFYAGEGYQWLVGWECVFFGEKRSLERIIKSGCGNRVCTKKVNRVVITLICLTSVILFAAVFFAVDAPSLFLREPSTEH